MSLNFTIENIIQKYYIDNNYRYSFVIYFNKKNNFITFVNSFIDKFKLKLSDKHIINFFYLGTNKTNTNIKKNYFSFTYIQKI